MTKSIAAMALLIVACVAVVAQESARMSGGPIASQGLAFLAQGEPAPDWVVWRAFHKNIQGLSSSSRSNAAALLMKRIGVSGQAATQLSIAGNAFLQALERLEGEEGRKLAELSRGLIPSPDAAKQLPIPTQRRAPSPQARELEAKRQPLRLPRNLAGVSNDELAQERSASISAFARQASSILEAHKRYLRSVVTPDEFASIEAWIASEVKPRVRVMIPASKQ